MRIWSGRSGFVSVQSIKIFILLQIANYAKIISLTGASDLSAHCEHLIKQTLLDRCPRPILMEPTLSTLPKIVLRDFMGEIKVRRPSRSEKRKHKQRPSRIPIPFLHFSNDVKLRRKRRSETKPTQRVLFLELAKQSLVLERTRICEKAKWQ